jgi:predicted SnoaL-like aldol condensation-catalyzing enzyme
MKWQWANRSRVKRSRCKTTGAAALVLLASSLLLAQNLNLSPEEKHNREIASRLLRDILQYGHLEVADEIVGNGYIQHDPKLPSGLPLFKESHARPDRVPEEIKPEWKRPPTLIIASGPFVLFMTDRKSPDPAEPGKEYTWDHFDLFRVEHGKIQEHWDETEK